jgi:hypothetical protein
VHRSLQEALLPMTCNNGSPEHCDPSFAAKLRP